MTIKEKLRRLLISNNFKSIEEIESKYFGDYYTIYENEKLRFIFSSSRSMESIGVGIGKKVEYDFALVRALLLNETILNEPVPIDDLTSFLIENFTCVIELFSMNNLSKTIGELKALEKTRASQMFGSGGNVLD